MFQDLAEALEDDERVSKTQLRQALRQYTSNWRYLHGCREGAVRVDLQGNPAGVLEAEHVAMQLNSLQMLKRVLLKSVKPKLQRKSSTKQRSRKPANKNAKHFNKPSLSAVDFSNKFAASRMD